MGGFGAGDHGPTHKGRKEEGEKSSSRLDLKDRVRRYMYMHKGTSILKVHPGTFVDNQPKTGREKALSTGIKRYFRKEAGAEPVLGWG